MKDKELRKLIGSRAKQRRIELGLNQPYVAEKMGVATSTIVRYEAGTIDNTKKLVLEGLSEALHVSVEWLKGETEEYEMDITDKREYTSGKFPYGYKRSEENKRKMAVDPEAADIVKKIFGWRISGKSCTWIANSLNELGIPSPGLCRFMNGEKSYSKSRNVRWKSENISDIVTNPVYLGHTVQGKSQSSHFKDNGKVKRLPREEWKIAENTHEPLVTEEQFAITMGMAEKSRKKYEERIGAHADIPKVENPLRSKIYCAGCGRKMFRRSRVTKGVKNYHFFCDSRRRMVDGECKQTYINEAPLMEAVREAAEKQIQLLGTLRTQWMRQTRTAGNSGEVQGMVIKAEMEEEIRLIKKQKRRLYEDLKEGMLEQEDFEGEWERLVEHQL